MHLAAKLVQFYFGLSRHLLGETSKGTGLFLRFVVCWHPFLAGWLHRAELIASLAPTGTVCARGRVALKQQSLRRALFVLFSTRLRHARCSMPPQVSPCMLTTESTL